MGSWTLSSLKKSSNYFTGRSIQIYLLEEQKWTKKKSVKCWVSIWAFLKCETECGDELEFAWGCAKPKKLLSSTTSAGRMKDWSRIRIFFDLRQHKIMNLEKLEIKPGSEKSIRPNIIIINKHVFHYSLFFYLLYCFLKRTFKCYDRNTIDLIDSWGCNKGQLKFV